MPQEPAGCAGVRKPALAVLVSPVVMLLVHVIACATHPDEGHSHATAVAASAVHKDTGADTLRLSAREGRTVP